MITFENLGSGSQKKYRGWCLVFAPFDCYGEYMLDSKEEIDATHIYATCMDEDIQPATVTVPVAVSFRGRKERSLVFWGGVSRPALNLASNTLRPSVDYAILEVKDISKDKLIKLIMSDYNLKWSAERYGAIMTEEEFQQVCRE